MSKVSTIKREELMDWAIGMMTGDYWDDNTMVVSVDIRHVSYENGGCSYLVVSDCKEKEIWFPIGPGIIGGIKNKTAKNEEREVKNMKEYVDQLKNVIGDVTNCLEREVKKNEHDKTL